jgi:steroid 5-alpha reductase family enzyme
MSPLPLVFAAVLMIAAMAGAWAVRMRTGQSGWIDTIWSAAVGLAGVVAALGAAGGGRRWLIAALLVVWSGRLALHIGARTRGAADDPRYAELARRWGDALGSRLFVFLQVQAAVGVVLVAAVHLAASATARFPGPLDWAAAGVVLAGVAGEALADAQLRRFRRTSPPGAVCDAGLWGWSRHPNYFFEWLVWVGFALFALAGVSDRPVQIMAFAAPAMMWVLLVHVSGIPPLEAHMLRGRGDAFRAYRERVSPFFPRPPRRGLASSAVPQEDRR